MIKSRYLRFKTNSRHTKHKEGFTLLELIYGLFFYALIQFTFIAVMGLEMDIYQYFEKIAYDDFDVFSFQFLQDHNQAKLVSSTAHSLSIIEDKKIGTFRYQKAKGNTDWIVYRLNGGYEPKIPNATSLNIKAVTSSNYLFTVILSDGKQYQVLLPLEKGDK
ncbi:hypothetical protein CJ191_03360 [Aerococcus viridans]|uniref:Competence protein ComGF n=1 Tax=Aerococcus viridans TaxID=1377 RepID=A0A2N6UEN4_9LACT|nr:hypothetical protein [Aerococcus viridans]PMC79994.1 hypothetical protein CJ191_03360 [Aerococcus viridans]